jgi:hypothetical protein
VFKPGVRAQPLTRSAAQIDLFLSER